MKKIEIVGLNRERKELIEYLQRCGIIDISDSREGILKSRETEQSISQFESYMSSAANALEILDKYGEKQGGMFYKRREGQSYTMSEGEISRAIAGINDIIRQQRTIDKNRDEIAAAQSAINALIPYKKLDLPMRFSGTKATAARLGTLEGTWDAERLYGAFINAGLENVYIEILYADKLQTAVFILYPREASAEYENVFAAINLTAPALNLPSVSAAEEEARLLRQIQSLEKECEKLAESLKAACAYREEIELFYDRISARRDKYRALSQIGISEKAFFITGFIPAEGSESFRRELLERFTISLEISDPGEEDDVPVAFTNNSFAAPVEGITSDYAMPSKQDIDPNPIMAFFYYFFFGMMFSDAGYGMLMMLVCGLLGYGSFLEEHKRKSFKMFFFCGVSTTFWGLMYGSFFGDMIATASKTFGSGALSLQPILLDPVKQPLYLLIMSVAFGMVHILTALAIKLYMTWKQGDKLGAIFDSGFWIVLLSGACVMAAGMGLGVSALKTAGIAMMIAGAAGLVLTQGRDKKNPIMKFFGGIMSLYDITSYVGDVLSYSRLMALGLATGVIASVVNILGSLAGKSVLGVIIFIIISVFGHALNFAINVLGAYVHTNRLQYVEFYQKFYEGGGRKYKPFGFDTKYYKFGKN